jgi:hypothetical protein
MRLRNADFGMRIKTRTDKSAIRILHSAIKI